MFPPGQLTLSALWPLSLLKLSHSLEYFVLRLILLIFSPDGWNYTVIYCKDHNSSHCNFSCCDEILTGVCTIQLSCRGGQCGAEPPCQTRRCSYNGACCSGCALLQSRPAFLCIKREWWATYKVWQYVAGMISNQQDGIPTSKHMPDPSILSAWAVSASLQRHCQGWPKVFPVILSELPSACSMSFRQIFVL